MIRTEEEARKTWCPEVRSSNDYHGQATNRCANGGMPTDDHLCIASGCSQWVAMTQPAFDNSGGFTRYVGEIPTGSGFCGRNVGLALKLFGLAGRPEPS